MYFIIWLHCIKSLIVITISSALTCLLFVKKENGGFDAKKTKEHFKSLMNADGEFNFPIKSDKNCAWQANDV